MEFTPPSKALPYVSWAFSPPAGAAPPSDVMLRSTLAVQVEQLQECLTRVGSFLERAEAALSRLSLFSDMSKTTPMSCSLGEIGVGSTEVRERSSMVVSLLVWVIDRRR